MEITNLWQRSIFLAVFLTLTLSGYGILASNFFSNNVFIANGITYLIGFVIFGFGIVESDTMMLNIGAVLLLICAVLFNFNVFKTLFHKAK